MRTFPLALLLLSLPAAPAARAGDACAGLTVVVAGEPLGVVPAHCTGTPLPTDCGVTTVVLPAVSADVYGCLPA
jgi:hypothetical protein